MNAPLLELSYLQGTAIFSIDPSTNWPQKTRAFFASILDRIANNNTEVNLQRNLLTTPVDKIRIMLADDDSDDRELFSEVILEISQNIEIVAVENGIELMAQLNSEKAEIPSLLFLDLNMPGKTGRQCLQEIRDNPHLKTLPVIMYSTSTLQKDISDTHSIGAQFYIRKPNSFRDAITLIKKVIAVDFEKVSYNQPLHNFVIT